MLIADNFLWLIWTSLKIAEIVDIFINDRAIGCIVIGILIEISIITKMWHISGKSGESAFQLIKPVTLFWIFKFPRSIFVILFFGTQVQIHGKVINLLRALSRKLFLMRLMRKTAIKLLLVGLVESALSLWGQSVTDGQFWIESLSEVAGVIVGVFEGLVIFGLGQRNQIAVPWNIDVPY